MRIIIQKYIKIDLIKGRKDYPIGSLSKDGKRKKVKKNKWIEIKHTLLFKKISKFEKTIIKQTENKYEIGAIFNKKANIILLKKGSENSIEFTEKEKLLLNNNIFTHNHTLSISFSINDIHLALIHNLDIIRAVAPKSILGYGVYVMENRNKLQNVEIYQNTALNYILNSSEDIDNMFNEIFLKYKDNKPFLDIKDCFYDTFVMINIFQNYNRLHGKNISLYFEQDNKPKIDLFNFFNTIKQYAK